MPSPTTASDLVLIQYAIGIFDRCHVAPASTNYTSQNSCEMVDF